MWKLSKLRVLITIVLLSCSINLFGSENKTDSISSTGELDSVTIAYNDLRIVNSKLIELKYEKEINEKLRNIIYNDSILIENEKRINKQISIDCKKITRERNICFGIATVLTYLSIFLIIK